MALNIRHSFSIAVARFAGTKEDCMNFVTVIVFAQVYQIMQCVQYTISAVLFLFKFSKFYVKFVCNNMLSKQMLIFDKTYIQYVQL